MLDEETLGVLYAHCICLVFPSFDEGFGLPPIEAMSAASPTIVSDIPVHREVLGDAAIYCDPRSPGSLKEKMQQVVEDSDLRRKYIARGLERCRLYSWERTATQTLEVYESVLAKRATQ